MKRKSFLLLSIVIAISLVLSFLLCRGRLRPDQGPCRLRSRLSSL